MCYVILSDIHANYAAVQAIEHALQPLRRVRPLKLYFLGDLLGYGPVEQALRCVRWLHFESGVYEVENEPRWIPGNHDEWAVTQLGRVRDEGAVTLLAQRMTLAAQAAEDWQWFENEVRAAITNEARSLIIHSRQSGHVKELLVFTHGGVFPPERRGAYLYPWHHSTLRAHFTELRREIPDAEFKVLFCGHTHLPFLAQIRQDNGEIVYHSIKYGSPIVLGPGEYIINPGSAGHPRDGDPRAAFVLFDPDACTVEFRRVEYDIRRVVNALQLEQGNSAKAREEVACYLIRLDLNILKNERGLDVNPDRPGKRLLREYLARVDAAYEHLIHELETGDGGEEMQFYRVRVYRVPQWDLEALGPSQPAKSETACQNDNL